MGNRNFFMLDMHNPRPVAIPSQTALLQWYRPLYNRPPRIKPSFIRIPAKPRTNAWERDCQSGNDTSRLNHRMDHGRFGTDKKAYQGVLWCRTSQKKGSTIYVHTCTWYWTGSYWSGLTRTHPFQRGYRAVALTSRLWRHTHSVWQKG